MNKKKVDPKLVKPVHGDTGFYDYQIDNSMEPTKDNADNGRKHSKYN